MQNVEKVYMEYSKLVYKYLFCLTHNREISEELTQETFLCALKSIDKFKGNCKISTWLCQIAKHLWYKEFKKLKKSNIILIDEITENLEDEENVEDRMIKKRRRKDFIIKSKVYLMI